MYSSLVLRHLGCSVALEYSLKCLVQDDVWTKFLLHFWSMWVFWDFCNIFCWKSPKFLPVYPGYRTRLLLGYSGDPAASGFAAKINTQIRRRRAAAFPPSARCRQFLTSFCRCGNVGKLTRIAATTSDPAWIEAHPRTINSPYVSFRPSQ